MLNDFKAKNLMISLTNIEVIQVLLNLGQEPLYQHH